MDNTLIVLQEKLAEVAKFEETTGKTLGQHLIENKNVHNTTDKGLSKGLAHTHMCASKNVNQRVIHMAMGELGWVWNKEVTEYGFTFCNDVKKGDTVSIASYIPVFYFHGDSLYWNDNHPNFNVVWELVCDYKTIDGRRAKDTSRNIPFKSENPAMGDTLKYSLRRWGITLTR